MAKTDGSIKLQNGIKPSTVTEPTSSPMGTYYLADNPQYYEPQRSNTFTFYVDGLDGILGATFFSSTDTSESKALELSVKSSSVPHFNIDPILINRGNNVMKFAGKPTFDNGQIVVRDYIGANTKEIILAWQRLAYNVETEKVGLAKDYKKKGYLLEYTPDYQLVRTWVLEGCWVSGVSEDAYDHDSVSEKSMNVTIVYDRAYIDTSDRV